jgi:hypothetical protein
MVFQKNPIQILKSKNVLASRNVVKPTKNKVIVLKNEIKQYFDNNGYLSWSSKKKIYIILGTNSLKMD